VARVPGGLEARPRLVNVEDPEQGVVGTPLDGPSYAEFLAGAPVREIRNTCDDEERVLSINYTSGTTGRPKGVMYTHRGALLNALGEIIVQRLERDSVFLWTLPLFHCNGWCFPWAVTGAGGTHVMLRRVDPAEILRLVREEGVTHLNGAPTVLLTLAEAPAARGVRFDPPIRVATGGAPPSPTLLARMEQLGVRVTHLYGLTETYGPHVFCEMQPGWEDLEVEGKARVMARQGVPYLHATHLRVVDPEMRDVPADGAQMGEVVMRGNNVMLGYYRDAEATAAAFAGGWFHSGDLGVMHPDGYIELRDRKKDIIISGGENISTIEVEHTVVTHPAVLECAVVAMPHEKWGEVPKAFVALRPGAAATEQEIIDFCRERLAHFKCPKAVEFTDLPKTSTGKIQKFVLREKEWAGREKRIQ
jgi:fatty-acyl-CoA synthase